MLITMTILSSFFKCHRNFNLNITSLFCSLVFFNIHHNGPIDCNKEELFLIYDN